MNNYSNYHSLTTKQKITNDGNKMFSLQLDSEGSDATIDGVSCRIIIHRTSNPINELKEERKVMCLDAIIISRGSIIVVDNKTYLVTSAIETNNVYKKAKMVEVNYTLKLRAEDGIVYEIPSILKRVTITTLGTNEIKWITLPEGKMEVQMSKTNITAQITRNKYNRFIIDGSAWHVSSVDKVTQNGVVNLLLEEQMIDITQDDIIDNIANVFDTKCSVEILNGDEIQLGLSQVLQLNVRIIENNIILNNPDAVYTINNPNLATVSSTGLITAIDVGNSTITVSYKGISKDIDIVTTNTPPYYNLLAVISGKNVIKIGDSQTYDVVFYKLNEPFAQTPIWTITSIDGVSSTDLVTIESQNDVLGTCVLKTNDQFKKGIFLLRVTNSENTMTTTYEIRVISRF